MATFTVKLRNDLKNQLINMTSETPLCPTGN